jgi:putative transcriptional regulator
MRDRSSTLLEAVLETATGLHRAGAMSQVALREFEQLCLPPVETLEPAYGSDDGPSSGG